MRPAALLPLLAVGLLCAPSATAAFNDPLPFHAGFGYMPGLDEGSDLRVASGRMEAAMVAAEGNLGLFATGGADLTGLTRVCWTELATSCRDSPGGRLAVTVQPGGSFGLHLPSTAEAVLHADHALAMFVDLSGDADLNGLGMDLSLLAPLVGGRFTLSSWPAIPTGALLAGSQDGGAIVGLDDGTTLVVRDGSDAVATLVGKRDPITFAGSPALTPVSAEFAVLPFKGTGATARFGPAGDAAAREGLDLDRIEQLMGRLDEAARGGGSPRRFEGDRLGAYAGILQTLFNGAILDIPSESGARSRSGEDLFFVRLTHLTVRGTAAEGLDWSGRATLVVDDGHVQDGRDLHGFAFLQMPWWGWLLWAVALGLLVARFVLRAPRRNARWDPLRWVGWVAGSLALLLVLWLWDREFRSVLGLSFLDAPEATVGNVSLRFLLLVLELVPFAAMSFAAIAPLRLALRNGSILARQGSFMGLTSPAGTLAGFLLGVGYLRAYLDLVLAPLFAGIG